ncbi:helix-turn-helix transcriptional regulator [Virgibacillus sp. W0430]|uniref:helix-turn-helix transcriptional regulator n=1 Tax=Virgibacillus sp. W0430 TaxID=3391580 RepID=UPI003F4497B2
MKKRTPIKQQLLHVIKKDGESTIKSIMSYFTVSEVAVRRHLHELINQGFIKDNRIKQDIGRPYHTYELTDKGHRTFPNQYEQLPIELLNDLKAIKGTEAVDELLDKRMGREEERYRSRLSSDDFDKKIAEIARLQDEKGYMVEYEKTEAGDYVLKNYNCPIMNLANAYDRVCHNEKKVLGNLFSDSVVYSEACLTKGDNCCKWIIKKPKKQ